MFESEGLTTAQAVEKLKVQRASASEQEQVEVSGEPLDVSVDETEPVAEVTEDTEVTEELDDAEKQPLESDDEESELVYSVGDEEVTAAQIKAWKSEGLMQADYTRKTQAHAEDVKTFDKQKNDFTAKTQQLESKLAELDVMLKEDTPDADTIQEWREYEPEKYIEYTEKKAKREKLLADSKGLTDSKTNDFQTEYTSFAQNIGGIDESGQATEGFKADVALMTKYAESNGLTHADISGFKSGHFKLLLDAAKFNDGKTKDAAIAKKVRKAPVSTKPKAGAKSAQQSEIQAAETRFKATGKAEDAANLRRLRKQLN